MTIKLIETKKGGLALIHSDVPLIKDGQSALELIMNAGAHRIAVNKQAVSEEFFKLSSGIAGEVAQKFANYRFHVAIYGDFSKYTSKPLKDYIYECNQGNHLYFAKTEQEAIEAIGN